MSIVNSKELIDRILFDLFSAEERRLEGVKTALVKKNQTYYPDKPHDGLIFYGETFDLPDLVRGARTRVTLNRALESEMNAFIKDRNEIEHDKRIIGQILLALLKPCTSPTDIRNTLPEFLLPSIPEYKGLRRTDEPAWSISHDARMMRQYEKILPKMEFYSAARMLY